MKTQRVTFSNAPAIAWSAVGAAGLFLGACSGEKAASTNENPAPSAATANAKTTGGSPAHASSIDPAAMELGTHAGDPVVGNGENVPSTFATAGSSSQGMALDVMESLAQVTFAKQGSDFDPSLSRDGQTLVFASTQHRPTADIYVKSVTGRTVTQLTADPAQDVMPTLSPDGQRVAFTSNRTGSWDIYVMSITGGQAVQVTSDPAQELHPSWSPDGTKLVFSRLGQVSGRWEMWVVDIDQPMSSEFIGYGLFPSWCPAAGTGDNGRDKIVYQRSRERGDRAFSIWTVDYKAGDASMPTEVANNPAAACINPTWSPDGQWIVYASVPFTPEQLNPAGARPSVADLWMCGVDGAARVNLTTGRSVNLVPAWGSDARIYFVSDRGGIENIWSIGTDKAMLAATGGRAYPSHVPAVETAAGKKAHETEPEVTTVPEESGEQH
jgi:TolB protein